MQCWALLLQVIFLKEGQTQALMATLVQAISSESRQPSLVAYSRLWAISPRWMARFRNLRLY